MPRQELSPEEILDILHTSLPELRSVTGRLSEAQLDSTASDDNWSIRYIVAHLHSCEVVLGGQMIRIVSEDRPSWRRLSPREYIRKTDFPDWDVARALDDIDEHRQGVLAAVEPLQADGWTRVAVVTEAPGKLVDRTLRFYGDWLAGHEREHLVQIRQIAATFS